MAENGRRRRSKWDLTSETHIPAKNGEYNAHPGDAGDTYHGRPYLDRSSPIHGAHNSDIISEASWELTSSESERRNAAMLRDCSEMSKYYEKFDMEIDKKDGLDKAKWRNDNMSGSSNSKWSDMEAVGKDGLSLDTFCENRSEKKDATGWGTALGQNYNASMSPGPDMRRLHGRSVSPKKGRGRLLRSQSRSRSRSPFRGSRREAEGWNDRSRLGAGESLPPCRDFAAGRCRKGNQCRYLHEDGGRSTRHYERDHHNSSTVDTWDSRYERGRSSVYDKDERFTESRDPLCMEKRDYSRDKHTYRHGNLYEEDREKRDFHRNNKSTELCLNYMRGRCQRGATCRYVHHDASQDGESHGIDRSRERKNDRGLPDVSSRHDQRREHRRMYEIPCKFFAEGRCRNGENCKFSHQGLVQNHPEGRPQNDRWDRNWGDENKMSRDGSKWGQNPQVDQCKTSYWVDGNSSGGNIAPYTMDRQYPTSNLQDLQPQNPAEDITYQVLPKDVPQITLPVQEQNMAHDTPKQPDQCDSLVPPQLIDENVHIQQNSGLEGEQIPYKDENMVVNTSESQNNVNFYVSKQDLASIPRQNCSQFDQSHYKVLRPPSPQSLNRTGQSQQIVCPVSFSDKSQQQIVYPHTPGVQGQSTASLDISNSQSSNFSAPGQQIPPPLYGRESQRNIYSLPTNEQGQFAAFQSVPDVQNFNTSEQSQQFHTLHLIQTSLGESSGKPNVVETTALDANSGNPIDNKVATSEQIAQISNISASLAQIFGNGQQLPQLYAALNPTTSAGLLPSHAFSQPNSVIPPELATAPLSQQPHLVSPTNSAPLIQSDNSLWSGQSMEPGKMDQSDLPHGILLNSVQQNNMAQEPQTTSILATYSVTDGPKNVADLNRSADLVEKVENATHEINEVEMSGDGEVRDTHGAGQNKKNGQPEEIDTDVQADGGSKKNKDVTGIKMFKHALVEFVKDLLKPTWKEGNMSKEAHKTIVKKVVDKVTGALQSNIPQTQEKIDQYLSHSKPKLSKLVQAYVEKYSKT